MARTPDRSFSIGSFAGRLYLKSSEEELEQEFNSLHAQREACEAFIRSQRREGWVCLPQPYDDGRLLRQHNGPPLPCNGSLPTSPRARSM